MSGDPVLIEAANQLQASANAKDKKIDELLNRITEQFVTLEEDLPVKKKYDVVVSTEFLIVRLRTLVEFEHILVKRFIATDQINPLMKTFFVKRDVYLAQISQKITTIQNDISIISKLVYQQTFNK